MLPIISMKISHLIKKYEKVSTHIKIKSVIENILIKNNFKNIKILEFGVDKGISTSLFLKFCNKTNSRLFSIDTIYPKLSKKYDLPLIPFLLEGVALNPSFNQKDGIHPNKEGTIKISETIKKSIINILN